MSSFHDCFIPFILSFFQSFILSFYLSFFLSFYHSFLCLIFFFSNVSSLHLMSENKWRSSCEIIWWCEKSNLSSQNLQVSLKNVSDDYASLTRPKSKEQIFLCFSLSISLFPPLSPSFSLSLFPPLYFSLSFSFHLYIFLSLSLSTSIFLSLSLLLYLTRSRSFHLPLSF